MTIIAANPGFFVLDYASEKVGASIPPEGLYEPLDYYTRIPVVAWSVRLDGGVIVATPILAEPPLSYYAIECPDGTVHHQGVGIFSSKYEWLCKVLEPRFARNKKP